jgi:sRNA-binding regulator protein Hfq
LTKFLFAATEHAQKHLNVALDANWRITFVNGETRTGKITEIDNGTFLLEDTLGELCYFHADKVIYIKLAEPLPAHRAEPLNEKARGPFGGGLSVLQGYLRK